jgi:macrolide transport system ATP-binding/permease protein
MSLLNEIMRRAGYLGRRSQFDRELDDEVQFHIETRTEELRQEGMPPAAAIEKARREFGPRARMREDTRAAWQFQWIEDLWRDLCYGARSFAKSPGFTAVAVLSLGIGVGANCVMFSIVDGTLLRPPRIPRPNEVVALVSTALDSNTAGVSYPDYAAVRDRSQSFEGLVAFTDVSTGFAARPGATPLVKSGKAVTADFFGVLGSRPQLGRSFLPEEDKVQGNDLVAVLSHQCWQDEFGADPAALGKPARINGIDFTITGVMPARFADVDDDLMDDDACFFVPLRAATRIGAADLMENRGQRSLTVFGRLRAGVPMTRARAEVAAIAGTLEKEYPETNRNRSMLVRTMIEFRSGGGAGITAGAIAMLIAVLVLLIACANVAGLLTSRAPARAQEIALRLAIGAGRSRLIRQLLTESMLLAAGGAVVGVAIGYIPIALAKHLATTVLPADTSPLPFDVDLRVLGFSVGIALASVIVFGLMPAFRATRADLTGVMKGGGAAAPSRRWLARLFRGRNVLVAGQVAISLLLLTATTVLYAGVYKGFVTSIRNPGFQVDHLLAIDFEPSNVHYKDARADQFFRDLLERLYRNKGVRAAAVLYQDVATIRPDSPLAHDDVKTSGVWTGEGFFDTLGIPILEGRAFQAADLRGSPSVAVVNDVLAKHYWPGQNAIGKQIRLSTGQWVNVIGVAQLKAFMAFGTPPMDTIFLPYGTPKQRAIRLLVRSSADPRALVDPIRAMVRDIDPDQVVPETMAFQAIFDAWIKGALLGLNTLGAMGVLALVLALVGLYGLLAYEVSSRTREIGIRMALGARAGAVVRMVMRQGIALAVCGVGAGVALNWGLEKILLAVLGGGTGGNGGGAAQPPAPNGGNQISFSAGTDTFGSHGFTILVIAVFVVTILAAWLPARRAARVDPNVALRAE